MSGWICNFTRKGLTGAVPILRPALRFCDFAAQYLAEATRHLAGTTREDYERLLTAGGLLDLEFGRELLEDITRASLLQWWHRAVEARGRAQSTGMGYLAALAGVLGYAEDLGLIGESAIPGVRAALRRRRRSKRGRGEAVAGAHVNPISAPAELGAFAVASESLGASRSPGGVAILKHQLGHVADLLQLDAGLRVGGVAGLRWAHVTIGNSPEDDDRSLRVCENIARGRHEGPPKSGRERRVGLSRRLRKALRELWVASGQPGPETRVLPRFHPGNYQRRHFDAVCKRAGLGGHTPKDLRDTFASQLLTAGVQLPYVSQQLGHSDVAVTARHYVRWAGADSYRAPIPVSDGEIPADLIARIPQHSPQESPQQLSGA